MSESLLLSREARLPVRFTSHQEHQVHQHQETGLGVGVTLDDLHASARGELRPLAGEKGTSSGRSGDKGPRFCGDNNNGIKSESLSAKNVERVLLMNWEASLKRSI